MWLKSCLHFFVLDLLLLNIGIHCASLLLDFRRLDYGFCVRTRKTPLPPLTYFSVIKLPEWGRLPEFRPGIKYFNQITYVHLSLLISTRQISKQDVPVVMYRKVRPSKNVGFGSKRTCNQTSLLFNVVVSSGYVYYVRTVRVPTCRVVPEVWRNVDIVIVVIINIITMLKKVLLRLLLLLGE